MQQIIKKFQPLIWMLVIMFTAVVAFSCNNETNGTEATSTETEEVVTDTSVSTLSTDSLPAIDTSASSRPEGIKTP